MEACYDAKTVFHNQDVLKGVRIEKRMPFFFSIHMEIKLHVSEAWPRDEGVTCGVLAKMERNIGAGVVMSCQCGQIGQDTGQRGECIIQ